MLLERSPTPSPTFFSLSRRRYRYPECSLPAGRRKSLATKAFGASSNLGRRFVNTGKNPLA
jgi:hypothetical protein